MACTNQSSTVTVPYPTGSATIMPVDENTCNALDPTKFTVGSVPANVIANPVTLTSSTTPAVVLGSSGIELSANGAAFASVYSLTLTYLPNGKSFAMTAVIGGPASPVGTTLTP